MRIVKIAARYGIEWAILLFGLMLHALWLVFDAVKALVSDPDPYFHSNLGLDVNDADGRPQDGVREGLLRIFKPGELLRRRVWHDLKNLPREWIEADPRRAARVLGFLMLLGWLI